MTLPPIPPHEFAGSRAAWALAAVLLGGCASLNQAPAGAGAAAAASTEKANLPDERGETGGWENVVMVSRRRQ
ncbi:MAG TPA: hypothetical protein VJN68_16065 [Burkholderiaceae bacterium]|nr:hypothetical protein [Burkholderiaceae bacterium]